MAVTQSCSFDDAVREAFFFPNVSETKEKKIILFHSLLRKEGVLGLLPTGFGKSLI